jgi:(p)ppGpp synthase/HD superfamily hydrolase
MNTVLSKVIALAAERHSDQLDKSGKPYILHCIAVMNMIAQENPEDYELMAIAIGHDLIEDTKTTYIELTGLGCSDRIIKGINALTKRPGETYEEYVDRVMENNDAKMVKLKDLTHNSDIKRLKGLTQKDFERLQKYCTLYTKIKNSL